MVVVYLSGKRQRVEQELQIIIGTRCTWRNRRWRLQVADTVLTVLCGSGDLVCCRARTVWYILRDTGNRFDRWNDDRGGAGEIIGRRLNHYLVFITLCTSLRVTEVQVELVVTIGQCHLAGMDRIGKAGIRYRLVAARLVDHAQLHTGYRHTQHGIIDDAVDLSRQIQAQYVCARNHIDIRDALRAIGKW